MFKNIFKRNKDEEFEEYEDINDSENIDEYEEIDNYENIDEYEDTHEPEIIEEYEVNEIDTGEEKEKRTKRIINIVFIILIAIMAMIAVDVICVARYNIGPFFAIRTHVYDDGGTKTYYGFGYKVIKYNQVQGRRDTQIGFWNMPYSVEPTTISSLDLAIEFRNDPDKTSNKYYKKFLRITGVVKEIDNKNKKITMEYTDPDKKYTLRIICPMAEAKEKLSFEKNQDITVIGTARKFSIQTSKQPNTLYMSDCFAE